MSEEYKWVFVPEEEIPPMPAAPVMKPVFTHITSTPQVSAAPTVNTIKYPKVGMMDVVLFVVVMHYLKKSINSLFPDKF